MLDVSTCTVYIHVCAIIYTLLTMIYSSYRINDRFVSTDKMSHLNHTINDHVELHDEANLHTIVHGVLVDPHKHINS